VAEVVIGAGSNLGDRLGQLRRGVRALRARVPILQVHVVSPVYESEALVPEGAPDPWRLPYLNLAVRGEWSGSAAGLVAALKQIELEVGRLPAPRWAPRELDLDLLAFGGGTIDAPGLRVPHPGLAERPFALLPLADTWPDWRFPPGSGELAGRSAAEVAARWPGTPDHVPFGTRRTANTLTEIVGILNLTPDSFSDGGRYLEPARAVEHGRAMIAAGAAVLDLGAESTRPGASLIDEGEEWRRLEPVLRALARERGGGPTPAISVDTRHAGVAERAIAAGADWINDVTGLSDPNLVAAVARTPAHVVVMHSLTIPPDRWHTLSTEVDAVSQLRHWAAARLTELETRGIDRGRVILDPGIGFGKTSDQSTALVRQADLFADLGARVMVGHSRKSFLASWFPPEHPAAREAGQRDLESAIISGHLAGLGIDYVRVHDVEQSRRAIQAQALVGMGQRWRAGHGSPADSAATWGPS
jgi:2-amino-4-hydroxy-6-hydroxymethyldihydropteridine diphosphokinase/dihydropteroate synthase